MIGIPHLDHWQHYSSLGKGATREEAIDDLFSLYDRQRGRRKAPARKIFEVYRAKKGPICWILWIRRRRR